MQDPKFVDTPEETLLGSWVTAVADSDDENIVDDDELDEQVVTADEARNGAPLSFAFESFSTAGHAYHGEGPRFACASHEDEFKIEYNTSDATKLAKVLAERNHTVVQVVNELAMHADTIPATGLLRGCHATKLDERVCRVNRRL
jgi:hypothetical protein